MTRNFTNRRAAALARMISTPALFARWASRGRWRLARHLAVLDRELMQLARGKSARLIVQMPPRHGKSELLGRYLPCWYLGHFPDRNVIYTSYALQQAAHYGQLARELFAEFARWAFGLSLSRRAHSAQRWRIAGHEGGMYASGVDGPLTGKGAHLLIIDDPIKNNVEACSTWRRDRLWDWFHSTALTRLEPGGCAIVNMTRWHEDDLVGRLLRAPDAANWRVLSFPAICEVPDELGRRAGDALWPERFPLEDRQIGSVLYQGLKSMRAAMPRSWWEAMYQQTPPREGRTLWPEELFNSEEQWFDEWPAVLRLRVMALDPALGADRDRGDFSAFVLLALDMAGQVWVEAELMRGGGISALTGEGVRLVRQFMPGEFVIEANHFQKMLKDEFEAALAAAGLGYLTPYPIVNQARKELRIERLDSLLVPRMIHFRRTPGTRLLVDQLRDFPHGRYDDGPDALEMAVRMAQEICEGRQ